MFSDMSATMKGVSKGKGKVKGKRTVRQDPDSDSVREVVYDRVLIFDIGVKICANKDYNPIREVWLL